MQAPFELPEEFNVYHAQETLQALRQWLVSIRAAGDVVLHISAARVQEVDGNGMQLLASLGNSGYRLHIVEPSSKFVAALQTIGAMHWLATEEAA